MININFYALLLCTRFRIQQQNEPTICKNILLMILSTSIYYKLLMFKRSIMFKNRGGLGWGWTQAKLKLGDERYTKLDIPLWIDLPKHGQCMPPCSDYYYITTGKLYMYPPCLSHWGFFKWISWIWKSFIRGHHTAVSS